MLTVLFILSTTRGLLTPFDIKHLEHLLVELLYILQAK
jgi:hypothetical protein